MTALPYTKTIRMPAEISIADERCLVFLYPFPVLGMHKIGSPWQEMARNQIGTTTLRASNGNWQSCLPGSRSVGVLFHVEVFLRKATKYKKGKSDRQKNPKGLKPQPSDRNMPTQHIAILLDAACCVRLATLLPRVATCWLLLAQM